MRVSLIIDGDSKEAVQAATDAKNAVSYLGKTAEDTSKSLEDGFKKASGAAGELKGSSESAGAANDNLLGSISGLAGKVGEFVSKVRGSNDAIAQATGSASGFATGLSNLVQTSAGISLVTGGLGLAANAAITFYGIWSSAQAAAAEKRLQEHARLIEIVRGSYNNATNAAGEFLEQSKNVTLWQQERNNEALAGDRNKAVKDAISSFRFDYFLAAMSELNNPFSDGSETRAIEQFRGAVDDLERAVASGSPNIRQYQDRIVDIARAARETSPEVAKLADRFLQAIKPAQDVQSKVAEGAASVRKLKGEATEADDAVLRLTRAAGDGSNQFDRLLKSMERQAAGMEAEAAATGKTAGAIAKLRAEAVATEAAQQSGLKVAGEYAERIGRIGDRAADAAQKLALARVQSDAAFQRKTIGLTADDATIAAQLRGAYGDDVEAALNSSSAAALKFNQTMLQLKGTTLEVARGAFGDFRTQLQQGATVWEAFGTAGVNALNRIIDKLADQALDNLVSGLFGAFTGGSSSSWLSSLFGASSPGPITLGGPNGPTPFAAADGGTFGPGWGVVGERGAEIIKVHAGGVTVFPHHVSKPYLPAFADGGSLDSLGNIARLPSFQTTSSGGSSGSAAPQEIRISVGVDDSGNLKAMVHDVAKGVAQQVSAGTLKDFVRSTQFTDHVARAYADGKAAWKIR